MIKSHDIACKLLRMDNVPVEIVTKVDGQYVQTKWITDKNNIWEFMGNIRIQPVSVDDPQILNPDN